MFFLGFLLSYPPLPTIIKASWGPSLGPWNTELDLRIVVNNEWINDISCRDHFSEMKWTKTNQAKNNNKNE